jgi:hypothetical protein
MTRPNRQAAAAGPCLGRSQPAYPLQHQRNYPSAATV